MPDQSHLDNRYFVDSTIYNCPFCNRRHVSYSVFQRTQFDWTDKKPPANCGRCPRNSVARSRTTKAPKCETTASSPSRRSYASTLLTRMFPGSGARMRTPKLLRAEINGLQVLFNDRPRKILNWHSTAHAFHHLLR